MNPRSRGERGRAEAGGAREARRAAKNALAPQAELVSLHGFLRMLTARLAGPDACPYRLYRTVTRSRPSSPRLSTAGLEQGDHVTSDQFKAGLAEVRAEIAALDTRLSTQISDVRTEIANLETRLIRWMVGTVIATATLTVGILRLIG